MEHRRKRDSGRDWVRQVTIHELEASLEMLRRQHVAEYADTPGGGFAVKFFTPAPAVEKAAPSNEPELCACKHHEAQHMNGLCVFGCDNAQCNPPTQQ